MITFLGDVALLPNRVTFPYIIRTPYIFNLEYVISDGTMTPLCDKVNVSSTDVDFAKYFGSDPKAVIIANNHMLDYGTAGMENTVQTLHDMNIGTIGTEPYRIGERVCILAYSFFDSVIDGKDIFGFSADKCKRDIEQARHSGAETVIVCLHWGKEHFGGVGDKQRSAAHEIIDAGADLIIGSHAHCIQPIECYKNKYICYGLGNCFFPNHSLDSHYDENGVPHRRWHARWCRWNRESLAIVFDEEKCVIDHIERLYMTKEGIVSPKKVKLQNYLNMKNISPLRFALRKYFMFIKSNSFVEKKLFDIDALKNELKRKVGK